MVEDKMLFIEFPANGNCRGNNCRMSQRVNQGHRGQQILRCREQFADKYTAFGLVNGDLAKAPFTQGEQGRFRQGEEKANSSEKQQ